MARKDIRRSLCTRIFEIRFATALPPAPVRVGRPGPMPPAAARNQKAVSSPKASPTKKDKTTPMKAAASSGGGSPPLGGLRGRRARKAGKKGADLAHQEAPAPSDAGSSGSGNTMHHVMHMCHFKGKASIEQVRAHGKEILAARANLPLPQPTDKYPWPAPG